MAKFIVNGVKNIEWSLEVEASDYEEAQEKALEQIEKTVNIKAANIDDITTDVGYTQEIDKNGNVVNTWG